MPNRESSCKMEINRRFPFLNINVNAKEGNKFSIFSCKEHENDPGESFQGSRRNIVVIMPLVNILHIHPFCFVHGNVLMNLLVCFWMKLSLPLSFSVSLCLFYGYTPNLIHHYPSVIMEISGDLLEVLKQQSAILQKI